MEKWHVATALAPLYKDEKMTQKKGKVPKGFEFELEKKNTEGTMLKTGSVPYYDQASGATTSGDGWLKASDCAPGEYWPDPPQPPTPPPGTAPTQAEWETFRKVSRWIASG